MSPRYSVTRDSPSAHTYGGGLRSDAGIMHAMLMRLLRAGGWLQIGPAGHQPLTMRSAADRFGYLRNASTDAMNAAGWSYCHRDLDQRGCHHGCMAVY